MRSILIFLILLFVTTDCSSKKFPGTIPMGRWEYMLLINGVRVGSAVISASQTEKHYISETEMTMKVGKILNRSHQVVTETKEFRPVKLEINNSVNFNNSSQKIVTTALFKGNEIQIVTMGKKSTIKVTDPFVIDGNYFMSKLIKNRFREGYTVSSRIFEPSIEPEETINVTVKVVGIEKVESGGKITDVIHIIQSLDTFKSVDTYINFEGVMEKAVIRMLNNRFELIRK